MTVGVSKFPHTRKVGRGFLTAAGTSRPLHPAAWMKGWQGAASKSWGMRGLVGGTGSLDRESGPHSLKAGAGWRRDKFKPQRGWQLLGQGLTVCAQVPTKHRTAQNSKGLSQLISEILYWTQKKLL